MGKKILYIVLGTLLVFGLLFLVWMWLFSGPSNQSGNGGLGSGGNAGQGLGTGENTGNGQTSLPGPGSTAVGAGSYNAQGVYVGLGNGTYDANGTYVGTVNGTGTAGAGSYNAQGVYVGQGNGTYDANGTYVGTVSRLGTGTGGTGAFGTGSTGTSTTGGVGGGSFGSSTTGTLGGGGAGTSTLGLGTTTGTFGTTSSGITWFGNPFNPTAINSISSNASGTVPNITSVTTISGSDSLNLGAPVFALIGVAAGVVSCAIRQGYIVAANTTAASVGAGVTAANTLSVPVRNIGLDYLQAYNMTLGTAFQNGDKQVGILGCVLNAAAKLVLQMITQSVVNWINGGFKGQPSFVSNYQQFFTNAADLAAGQFIQGTSLAFLCSPFKLQIKIAIAQSYANRSAQSCSVTKIVGNLNSFMNGNFSQGGWGGFVSFTTVPTNNPYGAYSYATAGLVSAQANALANAKSNISPTGFLNFQQQTCPNATGGNSSTVVPNYGLTGNSQAAQVSCPSNCKCNVATPGALIESNLQSVVKSPIDQLGLTNDLDQIINALVQQLSTSILYHGLTSLSQSTTQTTTDAAAQQQAMNLLNDMQSKATTAQQLGSIYQGSISDIESAQANLNGLINCWGLVASTTGDITAAQQAASSTAAFQSLNSQVIAYNNRITQINGSIAALNEFESQVSTASSASDVTGISNNYNAALSAGAFPSAADITTAQQNRTTLQGQLATTNQSTVSSLQQCQAAGGH